MKKVFKFGLGLILSFLTFIIFDLYITKGYFIDELILLLPYERTLLDFGDFQDKEWDISYEIELNDENQIIRKIRNNSSSCKWIVFYRDGEIMPEMEGIRTHGLMEVLHPKVRNRLNFEFDCGTGIGAATFCPFDYEVDTVSAENYVIGFRDYPKAHFKLKVDSIWGIKFYDIFQDKVVFSRKDKYDYEGDIYWNKNYNCNPKDSLYIRFVKPFYSFWDYSPNVVFSNTIKASYCDFVERYKESYGRRIINKEY